MAESMSNSRSPLSLDASLNFDVIDVSTTHLFRHASEITKETKGGYLQGKIKLPDSVASGKRSVYLRLSLVPAQTDPENNPFHLHPNLIHINMKANKKARVLQDGELPDDVDWQFIFKIKDEDVLRICPPSNKAKCEKRFQLRKPGTGRRGPPQQFLTSTYPHEDPEEASIAESNIKKHYAQKLMLSQNAEQPLSLGELHLPPSYVETRMTSLKDGCIEMGNTGLMLNIITPLQKNSKGGTTIVDVMKQRFFDLNSRELSIESLNQVEEVFIKKKEDRIKMQQVRLLLEFFDPDSFQFLNSCLSDVITNSKSKECGPLQLHDVNPAVSCCESETKIFILSFFKLVADVRANFILYDPQKESVVYDKHHDLMQAIKQPKNCNVFNQTVLIFRSPKQDYDVIKRIKTAKLELRLAAFRPSDKKMSINSFEFTYLRHRADPKEPDSDQLTKECYFCTLTKSQDEKARELPIAKPGVQRRVGNLQKLPDPLLSEEDKKKIKEFESDGPPGKRTAPRITPKPLASLLQPASRHDSSNLVMNMSNMLMKSLAAQQLQQKHQQEQLRPSPTAGPSSSVSLSRLPLYDPIMMNHLTKRNRSFNLEQDLIQRQVLAQASPPSPDQMASVDLSQGASPVLDIKMERDQVVEPMMKKMKRTSDEDKDESTIKEEKDDGEAPRHLTLPCPPMPTTSSPTTLTSPSKVVHLTPRSPPANT